MNEVLPDPRLSQVRAGSTRERTMRHMQVLLATAAAASASAGCGAPEETPKPDTAPSTTATVTATATDATPGPSASAVTHKDPTPPASASAKPIASAGPVTPPPFVPPQPPNTGFMVVDPVPQPFRQPPGKNGPATP